MEKQKVDQMRFQGAPALARIGRCRTRLSIFQVIGHVVIWLAISAVTLGIGALLWPYAAAKLILESIVLIGEDEPMRPCAATSVSANRSGMRYCG